MPEQRIEDVINDVLTGDSQKNALDFIAFLGTSEIPYTLSGNYLDVHFQGKNVCSVLITGKSDAPGPWTIWSDQEPGTWITWADVDDIIEREDSPVDERTKEIIWRHINYCASCGGDCSPGRTKIVLGKKFEGLCSSAIAFTNPDAEALDCAKKMIEVRKSDILKSLTAK